MAFAVIRRRQFSTAQPLGEDEISIQASGNASLLVELLNEIGVSDMCVVLADRELLRVGLRKPRADEREFAYQVMVQRTKSGKDSQRRQLSLRAAIVEIGLDPRTVAGRYPLQSVDDLLFIVLTDLSSRDRQIAAKPKGQKK